MTSTEQQTPPDQPVPPVPPVSLGGVGEAADEAADPSHEDGAVLLDDVRTWFARFISTMDDGDLDLLTLWTAHTWSIGELYTTPRLVLDSPVPESGKTTVLEHLLHLCRDPLLAATLSSPALITRVLDERPRTILIDEADRSLRPDKDGVPDLIAVINSGYKRGATRPVLVPTKGGGWEAKPMPTFSPVAMAGNNPDLPDDTRSRCVRVLLMPALDDEVEESDWEALEPEAKELSERLRIWAEALCTYVSNSRPPLPAMVKARARERWSPLKRIADAAGGRWSRVVDELAVRDVERQLIEKEDQLLQEKPGIILLRDIHSTWIEGEDFVETIKLIDRLVLHHPAMWSSESTFGKRLTVQRLGRMLVKSFGIHSDRPDSYGPRGYRRSTLMPAFRRMRLDPPGKPAGPAKPAKPAGSGQDPWLPYSPPQC